MSALERLLIVRAARTLAILTCLLLLASCATPVSTKLLSDSLGTVMTVAGLALAVLGIVLTMRSRTRSRLVYQTHDLTVIGQPDAAAYGDVKILFNNVAVPRVVVTQVAFWNGGNTTVRGDDIVASDPLTVYLDEGTSILGSRALSVTRPVNNIKLALQPEYKSSALLEFDYLEPKDGAIFEIIHTGSKASAKIKGSVRGVPKGPESWGDLKSWEEQRTALTNAAAGLLVPAVLGVLVFVGRWLLGLLGKNHSTVATKVGDILGSVLGLLAAGIFLTVVLFVAIYSITSRLRRSPGSLLRGR